MKRLVAALAALSLLCFAPVPALAQMSFSSPASAGGTIVCQSAVAAPNTGSTTENTVATCTVRANSMGANGRIAVVIDASGVSGTSTKTIRLKLGGTTLWSRPMATTETAIRADVTIGNRNSAASQRWSSSQINSANVSIVQSGTATVDTTADTTLTITIQNANAGDTATLESYQVLEYPKS